jgi:WD40 repeat protein
VAYSPDGRRIISGSNDNTVRVWDAQSGAELACLRRHEESVTSVAYSPDGRRIVSGSDDHTVRVWDAQSGAELACLRGHEGSFLRVAYSPDGRRIVSGSSDYTVRVWDAESGECLEVIKGSRDIDPIASAGSVFPWRGINRGLETVIEPSGGGEAVAWFPAALWGIATHPSGRIWAGSVNTHVYLIRLEGEPDSRPPGGAS